MARPSATLSVTPSQGSLNAVEAFGEATICFHTICIGTGVAARWKINVPMMRPSATMSAMSSGGSLNAAEAFGGATVLLHTVCIGAGAAARWKIIVSDCVAKHISEHNIIGKQLECCRSIWRSRRVIQTACLDKLSLVCYEEACLGCWAGLLLKPGWILGLACCFRVGSLCRVGLKAISENVTAERQAETMAIVLQCVCSTLGFGWAQE